MPNYTGSILESQLDWLTVSAHGEDRAGRLLDLALGLAAKEQKAGNQVRPWRSMGYVGFHVGRVDYGQRDRSATELRLSGQAAQDHHVKALSVADGVTRLDLALTWHAIPPDPHLGQRSYAQAIDHWLENKHRAMPQNHQDAAGGFTCYVGARASENFFRLYNKEAESHAANDSDSEARYKGCWRYELETKGTVSQRLADIYLMQPDQASFTQRYLFVYCREHGIAPAFPANGDQALTPGFRRRSDADAKLRHLGRAVRPTVRFLQTVGRDSEARDALGLSISPEASIECLRKLLQ